MAARRFAESTIERRARLRGGTGEEEELMRVANAPLHGSSVPAQRARKSSNPEAPRPQPAPGELVVVDERVLDDLSHELGNFFHKLYYWSDYIKSGADDLGPDSSASHMLDRTIHHLEDFLKLAMEYFQPVRLSCVRMTGKEMSGAIEAVLRSESDSERVEISGADVASDLTVMIDPGHFSGALRMLIRQVRSASAAGAPLFGVRAQLKRTQRSGGEGLEIDLDSAAGATNGPRKGSQVLEWAVAKKIIEMHGGELASREESGSSGCILFLPSCG